ncbi:hypothetical protein C8Q73DRAFT_159843 [Cubamyces lactineus]|nr:hypothetical protein C8Q73DRAFT_159843 [Cubamyces lactineus]
MLFKCVSARCACGSGCYVYSTWRVRLPTFEIHPTTTTTTIPAGIPYLQAASLRLYMTQKLMLRILSARAPLRQSLRSSTLLKTSGTIPAVAAMRWPGTRGLHNPNHTQLRRTAQQPEDLTHGKTQLEAVSGELPSTPVGPPTGLGGYGGGNGNGVRDAVLTTVVGVIVQLDHQRRSLWNLRGCNVQVGPPRQM